jgi:hypothetical protein
MSEVPLKPCADIYNSFQTKPCVMPESVTVSMGLHDKVEQKSVVQKQGERYIFKKDM